MRVKYVNECVCLPILIRTCALVAQQRLMGVYVVLDFLYHRFWPQCYYFYKYDEIRKSYIPCKIYISDFLQHIFILLVWFDWSATASIFSLDLLRENFVILNIPHNLNGKQAVAQSTYNEVTQFCNSQCTWNPWKMNGKILLLMPTDNKISAIVSTSRHQNILIFFSFRALANVEYRSKYKKQVR